MRIPTANVDHHENDDGWLSPPLELRFPPRRLMVLVAGFQILRAIFLFYGNLGPLLGLRSQTLDWRLHELITIGAAAIRVIGAFFDLKMNRFFDARRRNA